MKVHELAEFENVIQCWTKVDGNLKVRTEDDEEYFCMLIRKNDKTYYDYHINNIKEYQEIVEKIARQVCEIDGEQNERVQGLFQKISFYSKMIEQQTKELGALIYNVATKQPNINFSRNNNETETQEEDYAEENERFYENRKLESSWDKVVPDENEFEPDENEEDDDECGYYGTEMTERDYETEIEQLNRYITRENERCDMLVLCNKKLKKKYKKLKKKYKELHNERKFL